MTPEWTKLPQHTMISNSPLTSEEGHILTIPGVACRASPKIHGSVEPSQIWEFHFMMRGVMPSTVFTLVGSMVLSRLSVFDEDVVRTLGVGGYFF